MEQFKKTGKTSEELEEKAKKDILKDKVVAFIEEKESRKAIMKSAQLGGLEIHSLAKEFTGGMEGKNFSEIKKLLATDLLRRRYVLSDAVMHVEIGEKDLNLLKEKFKRDSEKTGDSRSFAEEKREARKKREKLPYSHKGIPAGDLD